MLSLGMDIGTSTVKLVLLKNQEIEKQWMAVHHGNLSLIHISEPTRPY